jgi:hypothetical protein
MCYPDFSISNTKSYTGSFSRPYVWYAAAFFTPRILIPLLLHRMSTAKKTHRLYHCKARLTDCFQFVYVRPASGDWSPLNLPFVIVADFPLKVGKGPVTVAVIASRNRNISELPVRR